MSKAERKAAIKSDVDRLRNNDNHDLDLPLICKAWTIVSLVLLALVLTH